MRKSSISVCALAAASALAICGISACSNTASNTANNSSDNPTAVVGERSAMYLSIQPKEAERLMNVEQDVAVIDVRDQGEYEKTHVKGAVSMPLSEMDTASVSNHLKRKDQLILVYGDSKDNSEKASKMLVELGYTNVFDFGGMDAWSGATASGTN